MALSFKPILRGTPFCPAPGGVRKPRTASSASTVPVLVTFIFSYVVSEAFVDVLQSTIEAVFLCYCASTFCLCWVRDGMITWISGFIESARAADGSAAVLLYRYST